MEYQSNDSFNMGNLRNNLPAKRGLSRHYSGKSRSFTCMEDIQCLDDLKKQDPANGKKRKKYSERRDSPIPLFPCNRASSSSSSQCAPSPRVMPA